jgi:eukaryotic-like serine/threonine-protein kinase
MDERRRGLMVDPNETAAGPGASDNSGAWRIGSVVGEGRYRLTGKLGRGGMAEVFAAEDVRLGRTVAVKLLRTDLAEDPVSKARFTREAQSVAGLNHHAVVAVYDSGEDRTTTGTVPYIVMELVDGHTIRDLLTGPTPPPVDQALLIVSGVLEALAYSHQHGIVHRDIKPANVIITTTGAVKVMDFGIARALHGAASTMTQTGMVMGTPQYLSPEQALGKTVDHRSDLYATGCMLYELLALRPPFVGESPLAVVYQHVQDEPRVPSQVSDRVPPELDGLVLRALAKQPEERFQSADEMRGVVTYAHQALIQQGGWTGGLWSTGAVTQAMPHGGTGTGAGPRAGAYGPGGPGTTPTRITGPGPDGTVQAPPLLAGISGTGSDDGAHGYGERPPGGTGGGSRWLKPVLFTVAAVLAIVLGVFLATNGSGSGDDGNTPAGTTPSPSLTNESRQPTETAPTDTAPTDTEPTGTGPTGIETQTTAPTPTATTPTPTATTPTPTATTPTPTTAPPTTPTPTMTTPAPTVTATTPSPDVTKTVVPSGGTTDGGTSGR